MKKKGVFLLFLVLLEFFPLSVLASFSREKNQNYIFSVIKKIDFSSVYKEAKKRGFQGTIKVKFRLSTQGKVETIKILQPSGITPLDNAVINAVYKSQPYPLLPQNQSLDIILPVKFEYPQQKENQNYLSSLIKKIDFSSVYKEAKKRGFQGTIKVKFRLSTQGKVETIKILQPSGITPLDNAVINAVYKSQPYPLPPQNQSLDIILPVKFEETLPEPETKLSFKEKRKEEKEKMKFKVSESRSFIYDLLKGKNFLVHLYQIGAGNSQPLKIRENQIKLASLKIRETFRQLFPSLGVEYKEERGEAITDKYRSKSYGVKLEHILYDYHQRSNNYKREKLNLEVAEKSYEKERNDLLFEILKAYYQLCAEKEILTSWEKLKKEVDRDYQLGKLLKEGHLITKIEYLKIRSLINKIHSQLVTQRNRYILALANLKKVLGIAPDKDIPDLKLISLKENVWLDKEAEDYINMGFKKRPEIALWEKSIEATNLGLNITKNEKKPKLLLESFWGKSGEAYGWQNLDLATTWNIGTKVVWLWGGSSSELSFSQERTIPTEIVDVSNKVKANSFSFKTSLLDKLNYYSKVNEAKVALNQAQDEQEKVKKDIAWEIQEGFTAYLEGKKEIEMYKEEIKLRKQELELNKELFKAGEIQLSQLIDNKIRLRESYASLTRAKLKLYQGIILIDKGTGFSTNIISKL